LEARKRGLVRSIGVCNFLPVHLEKIIQETGVTPAINQVELHPYFPQAEQRAWDKEHGIVTQAWSPLGRANQLHQDPTIRAIADRLGKMIPQVVLRWHVQLGAIQLPKAASEARQIENLSVFDFELPPEDMDTIATLARPDGRTFDQDRARYEEF
jgi:diketogulonate reductase-like aldo/keto reductase